MRNFKNLILPAIFAILMAVSFLFLDASKYDTADRIWLSLLIGVGIIIIPFITGLKGLTTNSISTVSLGIFCILLWISFGFSQTKNFGFTEVLCISTIAFFGISISAQSEKTFKYFRQSILFFAVLSAFYGFWYFATHAETRMAGLFIDAFNYRNFFPNAFADFILMAWPLLFINYAQTKASTIKKTVVGGILFAALYLTYSRGAWASFVFQIIILAFFTVKYCDKKSIKKIILGVLATVFISWTICLGLTGLRSENFSNLSLSTKLTFQDSEAGTSLRERVDFWRDSLKLITQEPLKGTGPMSFRYIYPSVQKYFLAISDHPHNWILKIGVENGVPAAIAFITFLALIAVAVLKTKRLEMSQVLLGTAVGGALLHNMVDYNMNFIPTILTFFILTANILKNSENSPAPKMSAITITIWGLITFAVLATSIQEIVSTLERKADLSNPLLYKNSLASRNYLVNEAEELITRKKKAEAFQLLDIQLKKNPLDARAWFLKENCLQAINVDPMNFFVYYSCYLKTTKNASPIILAKLKAILASYESILAQNLHYTAFSSNPEEAAELYEFLKNPQKAKEVRETAERVRKTIAKKEQFNVQLAPRTLWDIIKLHGATPL